MSLIRELLRVLTQRIRVTLSFNLSFDEKAVSNGAEDQIIQRAIDRIVDALAMPDQFGGVKPFIGFCMQHRYVSAGRYCLQNIILKSLTCYLFAAL